LKKAIERMLPIEDTEIEGKSRNMAKAGEREGRERKRKNEEGSREQKVVDSKLTELDIEHISDILMVADGGLENGHKNNEEEDTIETLIADGLQGGDFVHGCEKEEEAE